jgi:hypothetical protein
VCSLLSIVFSFSHREAFIPYLEKSFEYVFKMTNYPCDDIRKAAIDALCQFSIALNGVKKPECRVGK